MQTKKNVVPQVNSMNDIKKIKKELKKHIERNEHERLQHSRVNSNYQYLAKTVVNKADVSEFINTLVLFIKQKQAKAKRVVNTKNN